MGNKKKRPRGSVKNIRKRIGQRAAVARRNLGEPEREPEPESSTTVPLNIEHENISSVSSTDPITEVNCGRRIVNVLHLFSQLQEISSHGLLNCGLVSIEIISETRNGLISQYILNCKMCNLRFCMYNDICINELDLNTSATAGTVAIGCGYTQFTELFSAIGVPPMSKKVFNSKMSLVHKKWEEELQNSTKQAGEKERILAIEEGRVHNGIAIIDVIADGCFSKRSYKKNYSALSGAAAIIGKRTNKILFLAIKNKYCSICAIALSKKVEAKDHTCYKNYTGPSTGMESEILVEGFKRSIDMHNLIYGRLISDGDANTYSKILQTRPYEGFTVEKIECRNHLLRNMCNKLSAICTDIHYQLKYRKLLTKKRILSTRKVIVEAIKYHKEANNVNGLHEDIMTAPDHAFGRHGKCNTYFCTKTDNEIVDNEMFTNSIWQRIKIIIVQIASHARSLIADVDSNVVERYNSVVAKLVGGKRINFSQRGQYEMRCNVAALSFNTQRPLSILHKSIVGKSPRNEIRKNEERKRKSQTIAQKYARKKRRLFEKNYSTNYGEDCTKPDISEDMMLKAKEDFVSNLKRTPQQREKICSDTILQSGSSEWMELRRNILTASNYGRVVKRRMDVSCHNLVKDILYKKCLDHVKSIKHGKEHESDAIKQLMEQEKVKIKPCGLFIDPDICFFGATPDGLIDEDTIVEIKCPISCYKIGVEQAIENKKIPFYKKNKKGDLEINKNHIWYFQIQGQLHVTRKEKCLFGLWSGGDLPIKTELILKDDVFWAAKMEKKLKDFYLDCLLPELIDPRYPRKMTIRDPIYIEEAISRKKSNIDSSKSQVV